MGLLPIFDIYTEKQENMSSLVHFIKNTTELVGTVDEINAVKQACFCMLATEKGIHKIYDEEYGIQTFDLIGKDYSYIASELKRRITQTLLNDDRITDVRDFIIEKIKKDGIHLSFTVECIFGSIAMDKTIKVVQGDSK